MVTKELIENLENLSLTELDSLCTKVENLKNTAESKIVEVKEEDLIPERTEKGSKNR